MERENQTAPSASGEPCDEPRRGLARGGRFHGALAHRLLLEDEALQLLSQQRGLLVLLDEVVHGLPLRLRGVACLGARLRERLPLELQLRVEVLIGGGGDGELTEEPVDLALGLPLELLRAA
eukprot:scaffold59991_cov52-Phaeocystis_antarctica.AAC.1